MLLELHTVNVVLNQVMFEAIQTGHSFLNSPLDGILGTSLQSVIFLFLFLLYSKQTENQTLEIPSQDSLRLLNPRSAFPPFSIN